MRDGSCVEESLQLVVPVNSSLPPITDLPDSVVCNGAPYTVNLNIPDVTYHWQDNSTSSSYTFSSTGDYSVTITDLIGCSVSESCHIDFRITSYNVCYTKLLRLALAKRSRRTPDWHASSRMPGSSHCLRRGAPAADSLRL